MWNCIAHLFGMVRKIGAAKERLDVFVTFFGCILQWQNIKLCEKMMFVKKNRLTEDAENFQK